MPPPILRRARELLDGYEVVLCDVWGVIHDGVRADPAASAALTEFRRSGGTVVLISNAPSTHCEVATLLDRKRVPREAWDSIVTSGDLTRLKLSETGAKRVLHIGAARGEHVFEGLGVRLVAMHEADTIVATELADYDNENPDEYRPLLREAVLRRLPLICANPDLVVHVGERLLPCAGALAVIYEELGGIVFWAGKPHAPIYERALALAEGARGMPVRRSRILAIGDALRTDIAGAQAFGVDVLFIAGGIHRGDVLDGDDIDGSRLGQLLAGTGRGIVGVMKSLA